MAHVRKQVRDAFLAALGGMTGVVTLSASRARDYSEAECPAVNIVTAAETIEWLDRTEETLRTVTVDVTIIAFGRDGTDAADDAMDSIAAQIETRILTAVGAPWDSMIEHRPAGMQFSVGEIAERTLYALQTRFTCRFSAPDAETIG